MLIDYDTFLNFSNSIWMAEAKGMWYHLHATCGPHGRYGQDFLVVKHNEFDPWENGLSLWLFHFRAKQNKNWSYNVEGELEALEKAQQFASLQERKHGNHLYWAML